MKFAAVLLAAGSSSRMGGASKQLAELAGQPLVAHAANAAIAAGLDPIVVVLGRQAQEVRAALAEQCRSPALEFVYCERYEAGMAESLKTGVGALASYLTPSTPQFLAGAFVLLADMPFVTPDLIARLRAGFAPPSLAAAPVWNGRRGNPVLLSPRALSMLEDLEGDRGFGPLLERHRDQVALVEAPDEGCLIDIDTQEALSEARSRR